MENGDGSQVGGTGGEGFLDSTSWRNLDDWDNYENISGENNQEGTHLIESRNDKTCHMTEVRVRARGRDDAEYSHPKWYMTLEPQKDSSKGEHVIVKEHIPPHV